MTAQVLQAWLPLLIGLVFMQASPGPAVLTLVGYSLEFGRTIAIGLFVAFVLGQVSALVLGFAGLGIVLSNSPEAFVLLRVAGGLLLFIVGLKGLLNQDVLGKLSGLESEALSSEQEVTPLRDRSGRSAILSTWFIATTSPIAIIFYISVLPGYIDGTRIDSEILFYLLCLVFAISIATSVFYISITCLARELVISASSADRFRRIGHLVLLATGIWAISSTVESMSIGEEGCGLVLNAIFFAAISYLVFVVVAESLNPFTADLDERSELHKRRKKRFAVCCMGCASIVGMYMLGTEKYILTDGLSLNTNLLFKHLAVTSIMALLFAGSIYLRGFSDQ